MKTLKQYIALIDIKTRISCLIIIIIAALGSVLSAKWPMLLAEIYNIIERDSLSTVLGQIGIFAIVYLLSEAIQHLRRLTIDCTILRQESILRLNCLRKMLRMPAEYFSHSLSGEINARMNQSVSGFSQLIKLACNDVLPAILTSITVIMAVITNAPLSLSLVMLSYMVISIIISCFQIRSQNGMREKIMCQKNELDGMFCQSVQNIELVRGRSADQYEQMRLEPFVKRAQLTERRHHTVMSMFDIVKKALQVLTFSLLLLLCFVLTKQGKLSAGMTITVMLLFQQLFGPVETVYRCMDELASGITKANVLVQLFNAKEDPHFYGSDIIIPGESIASVRGCDIYIPGSQESGIIAHADDIEIYPRERVLLDGPTGCGKTSVVRSLIGYYPHKGRIMLSGTEVDSIHPCAIANYVLYVPQTAMFFKGSVRDNLMFGMMDKISDEKLIAAMKMACIYDELCNRHQVANPLDLVLDEGAKNLSAGQRQRLAIARVFINQYKLLILDEVTANLDIRTAKSVMENLEDYSRSLEAGILYISHDTEVKQRCDKSIVLTKVNNNC